LSGAGEPLLPLESAAPDRVNIDALHLDAREA